jgi:hypothetical protein
MLSPGLYACSIIILGGADDYGFDSYGAVGMLLMVMLLMITLLVDTLVMVMVVMVWCWWLGCMVDGVDGYADEIDGATCTTMNPIDLSGGVRILVFFLVALQRAPSCQNSMFP